MFPGPRLPQQTAKCVYTNHHVHFRTLVYFVATNPQKFLRNNQRVMQRVYSTCTAINGTARNPARRVFPLTINEKEETAIFTSKFAPAYLSDLSRRICTKYLAFPGLSPVKMNPMTRALPFTGTRFLSSHIGTWNKNIPTKTCTRRVRRRYFGTKYRYAFRAIADKRTTPCETRGRERRRGE